MLVSAEPSVFWTQRPIEGHTLMDALSDFHLSGGKSQQGKNPAS